MHIRLILKIVCMLLMVLCAFMALCALVALGYREYDQFFAFITVVFFVSGAAGLLVWSVFNVPATALSTRDGFLLVVLSWLAASLVGAAPFVISGDIPTYTDAFFETISGFSTTGASILTDIEAMSHSMLFWRSLTHWLGGMGIIVLTVAILPLLGIGGLQLIKAEAPGPTVDKLTPRIAETAKYLWFIYVGMTILEVLLLLAGGMPLFDSLTHTFGTVATGGFSTRNTSVAAYDSAYIHWVIIIFMLLAGINFSLHFRFLTGRLTSVSKDSELRTYLAIIVLAVAIIAADLVIVNGEAIGEAVRAAAFQASSILTTTGFATEDYERWPYLAQAVLFVLMFIGGCSGSTGGGIKVIRVITLLKQGFNEMKYLIHPRGIFTLKLSGVTVKKDVVYAISGFFFLYTLTLLIVSFIVATSGQDLLTCVGTALATVGNIGPGFGLIGPTDTYAFYPDYVKWSLGFAMLVGRLELYTVYILFTPMFWRR